MTDKKKYTAAPQDPDKKEPAAAADANKELHTILTAAGEPLPIDPATGEIDNDKLTDAQREELEAATRKVLAAIKKATGIFTADQLHEMTQNWRENMLPLLELYEELDELKPFIEAELKKEEYDGKTFDYLLHNYTAGELLELRQDPDTYIYRAFEAAKAAKAEMSALPQVSAQGIQEYPVTLDKFNTLVVFDFLRSIDPNGQITMLPIKEEGNSNPVKLTSYYSLTFSDDLPPEIKRRLTPFDRLVYGAAAAVQKQNGDIMSISQIHRAMGNTTSPNPNQTKKIHDSIIKLNGGHATIDCSQVRDAYSNEGYIDYYGSLFPMEMQRAIINGQLVEGAIHILRKELPLISLAKGRNYQIAEIPTNLLDSKLSQTDKNIAMMFHVLETLLRIKNGKSKTRNKILYSTIYEKMGAKNDKAKQRAKKAFFTYLDELKEKGFIISYKEETTASTGEIGVTFKF